MKPKLLHNTTTPVILCVKHLPPLAAEQLLVRIPNRGVFIATPDVDYIVDLYRARAIIEPAGALWGESLDVSYLLWVRIIRNFTAHW